MLRFASCNVLAFVLSTQGSFGLPPLLAVLVTAIGGVGAARAAEDDAKSAAVPRDQSQIKLVENSQSGYTIVIAADAPPPEKFAAEELRKYLAQISGAQLPIAAAAPADRAICVGQDSIPAEERDTLRADLKDRGEDGYVMRSSGKRLLLAGNSPRATLYSVYHFLEKYLGCGWCAPGDDTVPQQATIRLPQFHAAVGPPAFAMRRLILVPYGGQFMKTHNLPETDWLAKNRFNWVHPAPNGPDVWEENRSRETYVPEAKKRGLYLEVGGHTFNTWLPKHRYAKEHPDYYATKDDHTLGTICLSHPDVARLMAENMVQWLDENPEVDAIDLWHNDGQSFCHCPKCTPTNAPRYHPDAKAAYTKTYIRFVNQVAALVARRHPQVLVNFLAYASTTDCPAGAEPLADNVLVGLCLFPRPEQRTMRPLETSPQELDSNLRVQIPAWRKLAKHFYIYEYYTTISTYKKWSMVSMICADIRFFQRNNADGISSDQWANGGWYPLNMVAFGRLTWNPALTADELIADFCRSYYGPASDSMIAYWNLLEEGLRESWNTRKPIDWRDKRRAVLIQKALSQAENNQLLENRIRATAAMHMLTIDSP